VKRIVLVAIVATFLGCTSTSERGPLAPTSTSFVTSQHLSWSCLTDPESCGLATASVVSSSAPLVAGPFGLVSTVAGSTVSLSWQRPAAGNVTGYILEAGSAVGRSDIAFLILSSTATSLSVGGVPNNVYFVRIRAILDNCCGTEPSNEVTITVGTPPVPCTASVSPLTSVAPSSGGTLTFAVTADCAWTAVSNATFLTVTSGATGFGNGTVTVSVASNSGANRFGSLTIAGQTVNINQDSSNLVASFILIDAASQPGATTECRFRSNPTTCELRSTSFPRGTNSLSSYTWSVQYTYGTIKTITQTETTGTLSFSDVCGGPQSAVEGPSQPLSVTLTVTDNNGQTASAIAGQGNQPALFVRLFTCS
jgi:hypothetical protein